MSLPTKSTETESAEEHARFLVVLPLCIASFSGLLNVSVLSPFVALIAADLDVTVSQVGLTATAALVTTAVSGLVVGWLADVAGFRRVLVTGLGLLAISGIGAVLSISYIVFLLARVAGAVGFAATGGLPNAVVVSRFDGVDRQRALGWISAASVLAGLVGPPVLTFVSDQLSWRWAFALVGGFAVLAGVGVRLSVPSVSQHARPSPSLREGVDAYVTLLRSRSTLLIFGATILQMASLIGTLVYAGAYLNEELGLSVRYIGFAFAAQSLGGLIASLLGGRLPERHSLGVYLMAVVLLGTAVFGIYTLTLPVGITVALMSLSGLSQVTAWILLVATLARATPGGQGTTMVLNGSMLGVGGALGTAIGGAVIASAGYEGLGLVFGTAALFSGALMVLAHRNMECGD